MKDWKWLKGALLLGVVFFIAAFLVKPIGVSTQFSVAAGILHSAVDPDVIQPDETRDSGYRSTNAYYEKSEGKLAESIKHPMNYEFIFVLAIPLGALAGYLTEKRKKKSTKASDINSFGIKTEDIQSVSKKESFWKAYLPAFIGGFLLLFGARMADGCTSGHMFSGMMQGSVSGYIFAASVFAIAIPVALLMRKFNTERQVD